jgi:hypothetical protein
MRSFFSKSENLIGFESRRVNRHVTKWHMVLLDKTGSYKCKENLFINTAWSKPGTKTWLSAAYVSSTPYGNQGQQLRVCPAKQATTTLSSPSSCKYCTSEVANTKKYHASYIQFTILHSQGLCVSKHSFGRSFKRVLSRYGKETTRTKYIHPQYNGLLLAHVSSFILKALGLAF